LFVFGAADVGKGSEVGVAPTLGMGVVAGKVGADSSVTERSHFGGLRAKSKTFSGLWLTFLWKSLGAASIGVDKPTP